MENLRCVVERITYQNEKNGYSVIQCRAKGFLDLVTVVGIMPETHVGSVLSLGGTWKVDSRYGRQFSVETYEETLPATVYGIEKYLGSGLVKGIGPTFAKRIVQRFGADTLTVIETDPDRLLEVAGIGKVRVDRIKQSWVEQKEIKNIMLFLQGHDVSTSHATKIYKTYGNKSIAVVKENPYRLADDIWGIGFRTADTIASKLGFGHEKYERLRSGLLYTLNALASEGHCFATREQLQKAGAELLEVEEHLLSMTLDEMIHTEDVITEESAIYHPPFYYAETGTAKLLSQLQSGQNSVQVQPLGLRERIARETGMDYDETQMQAILTAAQSKVFVLTGGPGTGKTTTTLGIITAFRTAGAEIHLAAPTGRAAKRLSEATGMEAKTIHRLLEFKPPEGYQRNGDNPLDGDVLIVDECSMIDIMLMYNLLKAVPDNMTLILVGDIDQLPSVGAGNVLRDIIDSECFPVVRLTKIFRQAQESRIIMNAHRINHGRFPDISNGRNTDFFFMERDDAEAAASTIIELVKTKLPGYYKIAPSTKRNTMLRERLQKLQSQESIARMNEMAPPLRVTNDNAVPIHSAEHKSDSSVIQYGRSIPKEDWLQQDIFSRLARSKFRSRFRLDEKDKKYVREKGLDTIHTHAAEIIAKRLAPEVIPNDGKQTPMRGHPVFIGQHATATCCRSCLEKWHGIPQGRMLTDAEQSYVAEIILEWINRQLQEGD